MEVIQNLQHLCIHVLQPLRDTVGAPVYINSGYRSKRLNARVGGVPNSYHLLGKAADIHCDNLAYAKVIFDILKQNPNVGKVLIEASPGPSERRGARTVWVHVQTKKPHSDSPPLGFAAFRAKRGKKGGERRLKTDVTDVQTFYKEKNNKNTSRIGGHCVP